MFGSSKEAIINHKHQRKIEKGEKRNIFQRLKKTESKGSIYVDYERGKDSIPLEI